MVYKLSRSGIKDKYATGFQIVVSIIIRPFIWYCENIGILKLRKSKMERI